MMGIAHELITRGWTRGALADKNGVCLLGASRCSVLGEPRLSTDNTYDEIRRVMATDLAIARVIGLRGTSTIDLWNDAPERTFDEVLRVAKEADEILEGQS